MSRRAKGSMTVEASIIMPMIVFILMAILYLTFYLYDGVLMQSYSLRVGEELLWVDNLDVNSSISKDSVPVYMTNITSISQDTGSTLSGILDFLSSQESVRISIEGNMSAGLVGNAVFLGKSLSLSSEMRSVRIDYRQDRLKKVFLSDD